MFSNVAEALVVIAILATGALAAVVGGYLYGRMKYRRATGKTVETT
jgi:hypothetical protein